ncbi:hypothetical protein QBC39DRAFT_166788 [Podospora conica]|nr:hypothetical protein QBC39DRAFT_166788 [Schizothecium conicum]
MTTSTFRLCASNSFRPESRRDNHGSIPSRRHDCQDGQPTKAPQPLDKRFLAAVTWIQTAGTSPSRTCQTHKMVSMARDRVHTQARGQGSGRPTRSYKVRHGGGKSLPPPDGLPLISGHFHWSVLHSCQKHLSLPRLLAFQPARSLPTTVAPAQSHHLALSRRRRSTAITTFGPLARGPELATSNPPRGSGPRHLRVPRRRGFGALEPVAILAATGTTSAHGSRAPSTTWGCGLGPARPPSRPSASLHPLSRAKSERELPDEDHNAPYAEGKAGTSLRLKRTRHHSLRLAPAVSGQQQPLGHRRPFGIFSLDVRAPVRVHRQATFPTTRATPGPPLDRSPASSPHTHFHHFLPPFPHPISST